MRLALTAFTFAASVMAASPALACSCGAPNSPEDMIGATDNIFRAQIISATLSSTGFASRVTAIVDVLETYKGEAAGTEIITTSTQGASCGVPVVLGAQTVFFTSTPRNGEAFSVNLCSQLPYDSDRAGYQEALDALAPVDQPMIDFSKPVIIDRPVRIMPIAQE